MPSVRRRFAVAIAASYRSYPVPREDGTWLCEPATSAVPPLLAANRRLLAADGNCRWLETPLPVLRRHLREFLGQHLTRPLADRPLIVSGHQPDLFHPGVWFKNFLLSALAARHQAVALNILVDHDLSRQLRLPVPCRTSDGCLVKQAVDLGYRWSMLPWERSFIDRSFAWEEFGEAIQRCLSSLGIEGALFEAMLPALMAGSQAGRPLGEVIAGARHGLERKHGLEHDELPFSVLTTSEAWKIFVGELLSRIAEVQQSYRQILGEYRSLHRIRNPQRPIPDLARDGHWWETPFWVYSPRDPHRRRLWVQLDAQTVRLSDREQGSWQLPRPSSSQAWLEAWQVLAQQQVAIRPRALTMTLFLRMAVGDWFIHGIGGGVYDQWTDRWIEALWGMPAPKYSVATASLYLPIQQQWPSQVTPAVAHQRLRDWQFTPDRVVSDPRDKLGIHALLEQKRALLASVPAGSAKAGWHHRLTAINEGIRQAFPSLEAELREASGQARQAEQERLICHSREYSIAIFPEEYIVGRLHRLCSQAMDGVVA
jgi:hypothetical protein